jgi:hypothetical protein
MGVLFTTAGASLFGAAGFIVTGGMGGSLLPSIKSISDPYKNYQRQSGTGVP